MKIYDWNQLSAIEKQKIISRPLIANKDDIKEKTQKIIEQVKMDGDKTLQQLTLKFDKAQINQLAITPDEFKEAFDKVHPEVLQALQFAKTQIETNHQTQLPSTQIKTICEGVVCERQARPIERVGLYIPGGSAPLVSTVLMLAIPAQIAQCPERILCTPPNAQGKINPNLLVAAELCGIQKIYKVGGAQAIAAMAYGTKTIAKVDKIFGPGNSWVTQAKILVAADPLGASIDMPAGPSEVMVIADNQANCDYVAMDLLSQAEHGIDSQVMLITLSEQFAVTVQQSLQVYLEKLPRRDIINQALMHSRIIIADSLEQAFTISNSYAPEHLILQIENPNQYKLLIQNAGAVFLGAFTPETLGDYVTGSNHILPTYGFAKSYSGLSVLDFMKFINFQTVTQKGLERIGPFAQQLAEIEGLEAHKQAVRIRYEARN